MGSKWKIYLMTMLWIYNIFLKNDNGC
jgi:hypothetical protein